MKRFLLIFLMITVSFSLLYGQADYKIFGKVTDSKNNPIPKVKIILKNKENGREIHLETKQDGTYEHMFIPHALYTVTFKKDGYRSIVADWDLSRWNQVQIEVKKDLVMLTEEEIKEMEDLEKAKEAYNKAYEALQKNDCKTASARAKEVVEKFPNFPFSYFIIGRCYAIEGNYDNAITNYKKVIELKPDIYEAYFDLGEIYFNKGDSEEAVKNFEKAAELKQTDPEVFYNLGAVYFKLGNIDNAKINLEKALELNPDHANAHKVIGYTLFNKGDYKASIEHLNKYLEIIPDAKDKNDIETVIKAEEEMMKSSSK